MKTWLTITGVNYPADGSGAFGFRVEFEGWPAEWVTSERITHATNADGRAVLSGLSYEGLQISERVIPAESELQCGGITFTIKPQIKLVEGSIETDPCIFYLAREVDPSDQLAAEMTSSQTTISLRSGGTYSSGVIMFIGTETLRSTGSGNVTRHIWGTYEQAHPVNVYDHQLDVNVFTDIPSTMEGRRVTLFAYGQDDDMAGDGHVIWRGMVVRVPYLMPGTTNVWQVQCEGVTHVLNQNVAGAIAEAHPIGIYHHYASPFVLFVYYGDGGGSDPVYGPFYYSAHDINEDVMFVNLSTFLESAIITAAGAAADVDKVDIGRTADGSVQIRILTKSTATFTNVLHILGGSPILGFFMSQLDGWGFTLITQGGPIGVQQIVNNAMRRGNLAADAEYFLALSRSHAQFAELDAEYTYEGAPVSPFGPVNVTLKRGWVPFWVDPNPSAIALSPWRIYVDTDLTGVETVYIPGTSKADGLFQVALADVDGVKFFIDIVPVRGAFVGGLSGAMSNPAWNDFLGYLTADTSINALRAYGLGGVGAFVTGLKDRGRDHANAGDTPFITDGDLTDFAPLAPVSPIAQLRVYAFVKRNVVENVLREECKFINHFMRVEADGTIGIVPLPRWTETTPVDDYNTIGSESILTPENGGGDWPEHKPNSDGRKTEAEIQHVFSFREDKHVDNAVLVAAVPTIPVTKGRGKSRLNIKPVSSPLFVSDDSGADDGLLRDIGKVVLAFASINYTVVTITVPYTKFYVLCGNIVSLSHHLLIAGDGTRGVTGRRGLVIGREWGLDPAPPMRRGKLTILLTNRNVVGYAPSAYITDALLVSGNTWNLQLDSTHDLNVTFSSWQVSDGGAPDGKVIKHYGPLDRVRVLFVDSYSNTFAAGIVVSKNEAIDSIVVTFDDDISDVLELYAAETPPQMVLEYETDTGGVVVTASQRAYAYSSAATGIAPDGNFARRFS